MGAFEMSCEAHAACPHWPGRPNGVPHVLKHNKKLTDWWYESVCCGKKKPIGNMRPEHQERIRALRLWREVVEIVSAEGAMQGEMELTPRVAAGRGNG